MKETPNEGRLEMHVPRVNLADPDIEPTDAELAAVMRSFTAGVIARDDRAQTLFRRRLTERMAQAAGGDTGSGPSASRSEDDAILEP